LAFDLEGELGDVFAGEGAVELLFELLLKCDDANEGVFGSGVADFAADFVVQFRCNSHASYCNVL
jgi:hypothetical protein